MTGNYNLPQDANKRKSVVLQMDLFEAVMQVVRDLLVHWL